MAWRRFNRRRILYNRASPSAGNPLGPERQLLKWEGGKWAGWGYYSGLQRCRARQRRSDCVYQHAVGRDGSPVCYR